MAKHIHVHYHDRKSGDSAPPNEDALREIEEALSKATSESHLRELLARVPGLSASEVRHAVASYKNKKTGDATNHLGEKEYYTFRRWKEAVKAAYPNARFEGDQDMCNAVPGGEWDGEKGVVYAKKTSDELYKGFTIIGKPFAAGGPKYAIKRTGSQIEEEGLFDSVAAARSEIDKLTKKTGDAVEFKPMDNQLLQKINQSLTQASRDAETLVANNRDVEARGAAQRLESLIDEARNFCFQLRR